MELVHEGLETHARRTPAKVALVCGDIRLTYAELDARADALARSLVTLGVSPGDRVTLLLENSVDAVTCVFGVLKAGAAFTAVSASTKSEKLSRILADARPTALVTSNDAARRAVVAGVTPSVLPTSLIWAGGVPDDAPAGSHDLQELLASAPAVMPRAQTSPDSIGTIIYTSGTSGDPKGVVSLHRDMTFAMSSINTYLGNTARDVLFCALPLAFTYGLYQLFTATAVGATLVLERNFSFPAHALDVMERERVTAFPGVPTMFNLLVSTAEVSRHDLGALRYVTNAAAPLTLAQIERIRRAFPQAAFFSMYGQTECKRTLYLPPDELDRHPGSVGIPIPGTRAYVADENGRPVSPGTVGELVVAGPHLMAGYWEKPAQTAERLRPGPGHEVLMHTGDLFRADGDGYLYFVSRADDIIKTRGEKVSPHEVERAVRRMPGVADVAAVGVPDPLYGEAIAVHVVSDGTRALRARDVQAFCRSTLEDFMVPKYVEFCSRLPTSENGKTLRRELRAHVA